MSISRKAAIGAAVALVVVLGGLAVALTLLVDADAYKQQLEERVSDALKMELKFEGPVGVRFMGGLRIGLEDVRISNAGEQVASAAAVGVGIELLPLFKREIRIRTVELQAPVLSLSRARDGTLNFEGADEGEGGLYPLEIPRISAVDGKLSFRNEEADGVVEAESCGFDLQDLRFPGGERVGFLQNVSFSGELACDEIRADGFTSGEFRTAVKMDRGVIDFAPMSMWLFEAEGEGDIRADLSGDIPSYRIRFALPQFPLEAFLGHLDKARTAEGAVDFTADLNAEGASFDELKRSTNGEFSLRGSDLVLIGMDLDNSLAQFESSQNFNLVDVGAVFLAGPFGLVATKGYKFASLAQDASGRSNIRTLVSEWRVERGVARAEDVAMATGQHRLAANGRLNFVDERFEVLTIALLDANGCAKVKQELRGSFANPEVTKPNLLELIAGPTRNLIERGIELFTERKCDVFYAGSVAAP